MSQLKRFTRIPDEMLRTTSIELEAVLGGPSLFYLDGVRKPPLFVTVLQHGNEPTGFEAIQQILLKYQSGGLPRAMWLFVANVPAAAGGVRVLDGQHDYNRSWPGTLAPETEEAAIMREVVDTVTAAPLFASIDLHNNTGSNPHYGCVNDLSPQYLQLATLFARTVVFFRQPVGVQSLAMTEHCPAVTLECGQAGENAALAHAVEFLDACLHMHHIPKHPVAPHDLNLLRTVAVAKMRPDISFDFGGGSSDVLFRPDLDRLNFSSIPRGESIAMLNSDCGVPISVEDDNGLDISDRFFEVEARKLYLKQDLIPSMATLDIAVIRQDCLFYVMEKMSTYE